MEKDLKELLYMFMIACLTVLLGAIKKRLFPQTNKKVEEEMGKQLKVMEDHINRKNTKLYK